MKIQVSGVITVPYTTEFKDLVNRYYTYAKGYEKLPTTIVTYDRKTDTLSFPRNTLKFFSRIPYEDFEVEDLRISVPVANKIKTLDSFKLRDYQQKPSDEILEYHKNGVTDIVLEAGTSYGKSYTTAGYIEELQQKTLILVDRDLLVEQMYGEICANTDADIQIISKNTNRVADVNVATLQLMHRNPQLVKLLKDDIGSVIVDEVHIIPAGTFSEIVRQFPAKYRLGLSATPFREDGLTEIIYDIMGSTKVRGNNPDNLRLQYHLVHCYETFIYSSLARYKAELAQFLTQSSVRLKVFDTIKFLVSKDRVILLATDLTEVQEYYKRQLNLLGIKAEVMNGTTSKKERARIIAGLEAGIIDVLIGLGVLEKGLSIKRLDTIVNLATLNRTKAEQLAGRIRREHKGKRSAIMVDFFFEGALSRKQDIRESAYINMKTTMKDSVLNFRTYELYKSKWK